MEATTQEHQEPAGTGAATSLRSRPHGPTAPAERPRQMGWTARRAGATAGIGLLLMIVPALLGNFVAVEGLVTIGDGARTVADIAASEGLFRAGIVALFVVVVLDVVVAWALYQVFRPVGAGLSALAAAFRFLYAGIFMVAISRLAEVANLLGNDVLVDVLGPEQVQAQTLLGISAYREIWSAGLLLFGVHLLVLGYLAYRSGFVPRVLGALLALAGLGYMFDSVAAGLVGTAHPRSRSSRSSVRCCWRSGSSSGAAASPAARTTTRPRIHEDGPAVLGPVVIDARIKVPWRDDEDDPEVAIPEGSEKYDALYGYGQLMNLTLDQLVDDMRRAGVSDSFNRRSLRAAAVVRGTAHHHGSRTAARPSIVASGSAVLRLRKGRPAGARSRVLKRLLRTLRAGMVSAVARRRHRR